VRSNSAAVAKVARDASLPIILVRGAGAVFPAVLGKSAGFVGMRSSRFVSVMTGKSSQSSYHYPCDPPAASSIAQ